jgi:hypothetical protein
MWRQNWETSRREADEGSTRRRTHDAIRWTQRIDRLVS